MEIKDIKAFITGSPRCYYCGSDRFHKNGHSREGKRMYRCRECGKNFTWPPTERTLTLAVNGVYNKIGPQGGGKKEKSKNQATTMGISISEFRLKYDVRSIVGQAVKHLEKGRMLTQQEFVRRYNIRGAYRDILEGPEFKQYRGKVSGTVYWGHPDDIAQLKNEGLLIEVV